MMLLLGLAIGCTGRAQGMAGMSGEPMNPPPATPPPAATAPTALPGMTMPARSAPAASPSRADMNTMPGMPGMGVMPGMSGSFAGVPDARDASGTAWQPDASPAYGEMFMAGDWMLMTHYNAFLGYDHQSGPRGGEQFNSINWLMLMATRGDAENRLTLSSMFSLEPFSVTPRGYPLLFQSGEAYNGRPLVDRQHPHDFFMELAARYLHALGPDDAVSLYVAPSGEPALGPPAFPHRLSAMDNPAAPISHHWLDSTHIAFGVLTAGWTHDRWQLEGSWFNGHEPDQYRWNIERPRLDSYSGRLSWNPTAHWSAQVSYGFLKSPEQLHPGESVRRTTVSVMNLTPLPGGRRVATTLGWGHNAERVSSNAWFIESDDQVTSGLTLFGRAEYVEKTGDELALEPADKTFPVKQFTLGATHELVRGQPYQLALGASVTYSVAPRELDPLHGRHPVGYWIFLRLRPALMNR